MHRPFALAVLALTVLALAGCPVRPERRAIHQLTMEPLHVSLEPDPVLGLSDYDPATLFREGLRLHEAGRCAEALPFYDRLLSEFHESRYRSAAAFNAGRCLEETHRLEEAVVRYRLITDGMELSPDLVDALFRLTNCLTALERPQEAIAALDRLLSRELTISDRVDVLVLLGENLVKTGELLRAEKALRDAVRLHRAHERDEYLDPGPAARAEFRLAELAQVRFRAAPLRLPEDQMRADLEAKAELLLQAQAVFLRAMRYGDPAWATAAGYQIGKLYVDLYAAMEAAPVPADMSPDEIEVYRDLLRRRLAVLLRKALRVFEMTLELADRTRSHNEWTEAARAEMARIEKQVLSMLPAG